jgi:hypothetical protein
MSDAQEEYKNSGLSKKDFKIYACLVFLRIHKSEIVCSVCSEHRDVDKR